MTKRTVLTLLVSLVALAAVTAPASAAPVVESWSCGGSYNSGSYDAAHNLYVPCGSPSQIQVYSAEGELRGVVALPFWVSDVAPSPDGRHLYVTSPSMTPRRLNRTADGQYALDAAWRLASFPYAGTKEPRGAFLDTDDLGNVYLAHGAWVDASPHTVLKYRPDGSLVRRFGEYTYYGAADARSWDTGFFYWGLNGVVAAGDGSAVYTVESGNNRIQKWTRQADGSYVASHFAGGTAATDPQRKGDCATSGGWAPRSFAAPYDLGMDAAGRLHVVNTTCHEVITLAPDGSLVGAVKVGSETGPSDSWPDGTIKRPHGLAVAANGNVCVGQSHAIVREPGTPAPCTTAPAAPAPERPAPDARPSDTTATPVTVDENPQSVLDGNPEGRPTVAARARLRRSGVPAVVVIASCDERCTFAARATLQVGSRTVRLSTVRRSAAADAAATLTLRVPASARRLVRRAKHVRATVRLTARDADGVTSVRHMTVAGGR